MKRFATGFKIAIAGAAIQMGLAYAPVAAAAQITLNAPSCPDLTWDASTKTLSCSSSTNNGGGTTGSAPSACSVSVTPSPVTAGGTVAVSISCAGGDAATGYDWSANPAVSTLQSSTSANTIQQSVTVSQATTFTVIARNQYGSSTASQSVTVNQASTGGGTVTQPTRISCDGFDSTKILDLKWPDNGGATTWLRTYNSIFTQGSAGWGANDAMILRFTAPPNGDQYLRIRLASEGLLVTRTVALSSKPCEFSPTSNTFFAEEANDFVFSFQSGNAGGQRIKLNPGQVYYVNIANRAGGNNTCPTSQCDASISAQNPAP